MRFEDTIRMMADDFCNSILQLGPHNKLGSLRAFPQGACGDVTLLFARYLHSKGLPTATYVSGERGAWTHAWLEIGDLAIDLAADQFPDAPERLIVARNSSWHLQFERVREGPADIECYDKFTRPNLLEAYDQIVSNIPTNREIGST